MIDIIEYPTADADLYLELLPPETTEQLTGAAEQFRNGSVMHINSTAYGGGVAEILHSLVPLSNAMGINTQRAVISPRDVRFFDVTKRIHNMLQGAEGELTDDELAIYYGCLDDIAGEIDESDCRRTCGSFTIPNCYRWPDCWTGKPPVPGSG